SRNRCDYHCVGLVPHRTLSGCSNEDSRRTGQDIRDGREKGGHRKRPE
ncbi:hypothetical protein NPIL_609641, partial [Nephila pilipes]